MNYSHGLSRIPEYKVWCSMKGRATSPSNSAYTNYMGRGIGMSDAWKDFANFMADMGRRPSPSHTLERVDNDRGYSADNCIWADRTAQSRNRRNNVVLSIDGESMPLSAWVERCGLVSERTVRERIRKGWEPKRALTEPLVVRRKCIPRGKTISTAEEPTYQGLPLSEVIAASGLAHGTVMQRIRRGWSIADAVSHPAKKGPHEFGARHGVQFNEPQEQAA